MTDLVSDGQPFETPLGAAMEGYAKTPPSLASGMAALAEESSSVLPLARAVERGQYEGSSAADQGLFAFFTQDELGNAVMGAPGSVKTPMLSAEEANKKYAPVGPDGKPVPITDGPVPEGVAQSIGRAKAREIEREGVLARFENAHSWPVNFATGTAAFMLDPLNAASTFLPGIGEETVAARLGGGWLARIAGRGVAGAAVGAVSQAPMTALKYGLGTEEASDYALRDAFRDMGFAAAGGAVMQAGIGTAGELLRARRGAAETVKTPQGEAADILTAPATVKADAMRAAVSQVVEGRPVDVEPVLDEARSAAARRGMAPSNATPEMLMSGQYDKAILRRDGKYIAWTRTWEGPARPEYVAALADLSDKLRAAAQRPPAEIAAEQQAIGRNGFAPGIPQGDFDRAYQPAYGPKEAPEEAAPATVARAGEQVGKPQAETGLPADRAPGEAIAPQDREMAEAEAALSPEARAAMAPEERAELEAADREAAHAESTASAYQEAGNCLSVA